MPDPAKTAAAQSKMNIDTATAQQNLNMVDQTNPFGSTTYKQIGTNADGTPKYQQNTSLAPGLQNAVDSAYNTISQPFSMDTSAIESHLGDLYSSRVNPQLERRRASTEQDLFNRGVRPGTEAYKRGMEAVSQGENDAWNEMALTGRQQALSELLTGRQQPINELTALMSGTQMNAPAPQSGVAPTDYAGLVGQKYQADSNQYGQMWNGIGQLAGAAGGWMFSDKRLKSDVHDTGAETEDGIPVKTFRYKGSPMMHLGVIAQEAAKKRPDAVRRGPGGFMMVNMPKLAEA